MKINFLQHSKKKSVKIKRNKLPDSDLSFANLYGANLNGANLYGANLRNAKLNDANLYGANLSGANLYGANLYDANLNGANLSGANLYGANLYDAKLNGANLYDAKLPAPSSVLLAEWGVVSDELCVLLMAYDCANHPDPDAFLRWTDGGVCPYDEVRIQRSANFNEESNLYTPGAPVLSAFELMKMVIVEVCKDSDYHTNHSSNQ